MELGNFTPSTRHFDVRDGLLDGHLNLTYRTLLPFTLKSSTFFHLDTSPLLGWGLPDLQVIRVGSRPDSAWMVAVHRTQSLQATRDGGNAKEHVGQTANARIVSLPQLSVPPRAGSNDRPSAWHFLGPLPRCTTTPGAKAGVVGRRKHTPEP